jgi:hypothetical protein
MATLKGKVVSLPGMTRISKRKKRRGLLDGPRPLGIAPTGELACRHNFSKPVNQHNGMLAIAWPSQGSDPTQNGAERIKLLSKVIGAVRFGAMRFLLAI